MKKRWFRHQQVIFDCDSTLCTIEGIDLLAEKSGKAQQVKAMTDAAMDGDIALEEVYGARLSLINPTQSDVRQLTQKYIDTVVDDASDVIRLLRDHGHEVHIVSGGLYEPVREFGIALGVKADNIHAVRVGYNQLSGNWWQSQSQQGNYLSHDKGPLTKSDGKEAIIRKILSLHEGRSMLIGDGISDMLAANAVDQFVGYGGVVSREKVKAGSNVFIRCRSLLPILALAGSQVLIKWLNVSHHELAQKTRALIEQDVDFVDAQAKQELLEYF